MVFSLPPSDFSGTRRPGHLSPVSAPGTFPQTPIFGVYKLTSATRPVVIGKCMFTSATRNFHKFASATKAANISDYAILKLANA